MYAIRCLFQYLLSCKAFSDGPIDISFNYLEAGRQLMLLGLYDLAEQSLSSDKLPGLNQEGLLVEKGRLELQRTTSGASEYFEGYQAKRRCHRGANRHYLA